MSKKQEKAVAKFNLHLKPFFHGPEHNDYYVVNDALECLLKEASPKTQKRALKRFHSITTQGVKGPQLRYPISAVHELKAKKTDRKLKMRKSA